MTEYYLARVARRKIFKQSSQCAFYNHIIFISLDDILKTASKGIHKSHSIFLLIHGFTKVLQN